MSKTYTCAECACHLIAERDWRAASAEQRTWWRENNRHKRSAHGLCGACYARARYHDRIDPTRAKNRGLTPETIARIVKLRGEGWRQEAIAIEVGVACSTVSRHTKGIKRGAGEGGNPEDPNIALRGGRWMPRRRNGLVVQVWVAA